jgi:hypothetical protein
LEENIKVSYVIKRLLFSSSYENIEDVFAFQYFSKNKDYSKEEIQKGWNVFDIDKEFKRQKLKTGKKGFF